MGVTIRWLLRLKKVKQNYSSVVVPGSPTVKLISGFCSLHYSDLLARNAFHSYPGLIIHYNATILSIKMAVDLIRWPMLECTVQVSAIYLLLCDHLQVLVWP